MKYRLFIPVLFSIIAAANDPSICPVTESPADSSVFVEYNGQKVFFCCAGCIPSFQEDPESYLKTSSDSSTVQTVTDKPTQVVYQIFGMDCPGCHGGVEKLLKKINGIKSAKANYLKQEVFLVLEPDSKLDEKAVREAIEAANFTMGKRIN
ncbi:MAG: cation transporter [Candidatus Marinimicrobia bacterium]|nr:cation transporter [Candidatus Neomarinimicrobiota bacterium]MCH7763867.1 cation transporter [Candidatus Neomarinimicrobiota bacterium]